MLFINTIFELDTIFSRNDEQTGKRSDILFLSVFIGTRRSTRPIEEVSFDILSTVNRRGRSFQKEDALICCPTTHVLDPRDILQK